MASEQPTTSDKCEHGNEHASCPECNPIFQEAYVPGFHSITVTGDEAGRIVTTIDMQDVTADPLFLGDPPVLSNSGFGSCSFCGRYEHWLNGVSVGVRAGHRFDLSPAGGYYSDELLAGVR